MRKIYAIGVGGSGAKCLESALFLHSVGALGNDTSLGLFLVDADASNGNSERTRINLDHSLKAQTQFANGSSPLMRGSLSDYGVWNPLAEVINQNNLETIFNKQALTAGSPPLAKLFDLLYSPAEQSADLRVGFRGRPPIGSAVMSRLELTDLNHGDSWQRLFTNIEAVIGGGAGDEVAIHLFGSVFGGTGASGVPTLATLINNHLTQKGLRDRLHLNASLLLPYFGFERPNDGDQKVFAEAQFFAMNTQAALQYLTEHSQNIFDSVYLLGNTETTTYKPSTGGTTQQNDAHFVEVYAALALNHGWTQPINNTQAVYISREGQDRLTWGDLPGGDEVKQSLTKGVRFAYAWLYNVSKELEAARLLGAKKFAKGAPWFPRFFSLKSQDSEFPLVGDEEQVTNARLLDNWSRSFLIWAQQVAKSNRQGEVLFQLNTPQNYGEDLSNLVMDGPRSQADQDGDRLDRFKNELADQIPGVRKGVYGLAHALFNLM